MSKIDNTYKTELAPNRAHTLKQALIIIKALDEQAAGDGQHMGTWFRNACFDAKEGIHELLFAAGEE